MGTFTSDDGRQVYFGRITTAILLLFFGFVFAVMAGCPRYNVWRAGLQGEASLKRAEQDRQIRVQEAKANLEAQKLNAMAEVERAKGTKQANEIIADSLTGHEEYLRYLLIQSFEHVASVPGGGSQVIYVPTEAMMPITESYRLQMAEKKRVINRALMENQMPSAAEAQP